MTTSEKVAYLKGLCEGMGVDGDSREGKLFRVITEVLEELAHDLADTQDSVDDLADVVDEISDDLAELEDEYYEDCCGDCESCGGCGMEEDFEDDEDDEDFVFYSVECPGCGFKLTVDEEVLDTGKFECPECGEVIDFAKAKVEPVSFDEAGDDLPF